MISQVWLRSFQNQVRSQPFLWLVRNGASFPVRHRSRLRLCDRIHGFQGHAEELSATDLLGCRRESLLGLVYVIPQPQAGYKSLSGFVEASERGDLWGFGRGRKLVTEDSKPVGSGRFRVPSQDSSWVLGPTWSSSFPLRQGPHLGSSSESKDLTALKGQTAPPLYQDTTLSASQNRGGLSANSTRVR